MRVKVVHVESEWDMRKKHALRESRKANRLTRGQCLVAFNGALTMARIIDSEGGVHDYYADRGVKFDLAVLKEMIQQGFAVDLDVGKTTSVRAAPRLRAAA